MIELPAFAQEDYHLNKMVEEANKKAELFKQTTSCGEDKSMTEEERQVLRDRLEYVRNKMMLYSNTGCAEYLALAKEEDELTDKLCNSAEELISTFIVNSTFILNQLGKMIDCRPNWYKNYSSSLQNWTDGKSDYRVIWKDNEGTEYRYATFATDTYDAISRCSMAHPLVVNRIVDVHVFAFRDLMTLEQYMDKVENVLVVGYGYKPGVTNYFPITVVHEYNVGSTPEEAADKLRYEIEYGDEGT